MAERMAMEGVCTRVAKTLRFLWSDAEVELTEDSHRGTFGVRLSTEMQSRRYYTYTEIDRCMLLDCHDRMYEHLLDVLPRRHVLDLLHVAKQAAARSEVF